jgi:hypothetical protein
MRAISATAKPPRGRGPLLQVVSPTRTTRIPSNSSSLRVVMTQTANEAISKNPDNIDFYRAKV